MPVREVTQTVEARGQSARVLVAGDGEPVVVLHGWGGRIESMTPTLMCLRKSWKVVAIDLPGFGESPVPDGVWGTPDYATFVRDLLGELEIENAKFVGHSFGAKTSLYLAATHPGLVAKLVATGASGLRRAPTLKARGKRALSRTARYAGALGPVGRQLRDTVYERIASQDYRDAGAMRPILVKVVNEDIGPLLGRVACPTLLIWGSEDDAVPLSQARRMESLIPDAGLVTFDGAGHFAYLDESDRFCRVVSHFFGAPAD
jgi:pimeloyl-ACP methyl ester carboxylesterase